MKVLSKEEAATWCEAHRIGRGLPERFDADLEFKIPVDAGKRVAMVGRAMKPFEDEPLFLVLFSEWSVWRSGERMHVFDRFRMSYGETRRLIEAPGHVFNQTEIEDAISFVTIAVLFLWNCHVVTPERRKVLYFSHDEWGFAKGVEFEFEGVQKARRVKH